MLPPNVIIIPDSDFETKYPTSIHFDLKRCIGKGELWMAKDEKTGLTRLVFISSQEQEQTSSEDEAPKINTDPLFEKAVQLCSTNERITAKMLEKEFKIGYGRAAKLMEQLNYFGYISIDVGESLNYSVPF
ncbi:MAG: hypothetical protein IKX40_08855 [Thermoguttaceae bacterium]|nr:hypothetical protein [Thermoguttaceae bacterium]